MIVGGGLSFGVNYAGALIVHAANQTMRREIPRRVRRMYGRTLLGQLWHILKEGRAICRDLDIVTVSDEPGEVCWFCRKKQAREEAD